MKINRTNKILSLLLSLLMLVSMLPMSVLAEETDTARTFYVEADQPAVYAGDLVTITVRVDGEKLYGAEWALAYDDTKFELVSKPAKEFYIEALNTPIDPNVPLATYTFTAKTHATVVTGSFELTHAKAQTRLEAAEGTIIAADIENTDVTILLRDGLDTEVSINGNPTSGNSETVTYTDSGYTVSLKPVIEGVETSAANIEIYVNDVPKSSTEFILTEVGDHVIKYVTTLDGYEKNEETFTLTIAEDTFDVDIEFDGNPITSNVIDVEFDGQAHTLNITSDPTVDAVITVDGVPTPADELTFTNKGEYVIEYTISKYGFTQVNGTITVNVTVPEYVVEVNLDSDYIAGKKIVLVYTNSDKISFDYSLATGELPMYDVTSKGYTYSGTEAFEKTSTTKVYAVVVDALEGGTFDDYADSVMVAYYPLDGAYVIEESATGLECDINNSKSIELGDPIAAFATFHGDEEYYPELMAVILRADIEKDKDVDGKDTKACTDAFVSSVNNG